jgi:hypothetical protein
MKTIGVDKIQSYMRFQTVYSYAPFLDVRFENVLLKWNKNLYGITGALHTYIQRERERERGRETHTPHILTSAHTHTLTVLPPRRKKCFFSTTGAMDMPVSKLFVDAYFPEASRTAALKMLHEIRTHSQESSTYLLHNTKLYYVVRL